MIWLEFWGGTHGGTYYKKSPAVEAKKHIFLHCNASNLVRKILQHDKIWGDNPPPPSNSGGDLYPPSLPPWSTPIGGGKCPLPGNVVKCLCISSYSKSLSRPICDYAVLIERAELLTCTLSQTTQYLDSWQSDLLQSELKMKLLQVDGRGRCPGAP